MAIDLRKEFDKILLEYGHTVRYARVTDLPCPVQLDSHDNCKVCLGTGRVLEYENQVVRRSTASIPESWPRATNLKAIGNWQIPAYIYYMKYTSDPQTMDLIIDGDQILEVNFVDSLKGDKGRIEYYRVAVEYKITKQHLI